MIVLALVNLGMLLAMGMVAFSSWSMICNYWTHTDIMKLIETMRNRPVSAPQLLHALQAVPYTTHLRARLLRRDPWALYDPVIRDALDNPRTEVIHGIERVPVSGDPPPRLN